MEVLRDFLGLEGDDRSEGGDAVVQFDPQPSPCGTYWFQDRSNYMSGAQQHVSAKMPAVVRQARATQGTLEMKWEFTAIGRGCFDPVDRSYSFMVSVDSTFIAVKALSGFGDANGHEFKKEHNY